MYQNTLFGWFKNMKQLSSTKKQNARLGHCNVVSIRCTRSVKVNIFKRRVIRQWNYNIKAEKVLLANVNSRMPERYTRSKAEKNSLVTGLGFLLNIRFSTPKYNMCSSFYNGFTNVFRLLFGET